MKTMGKSLLASCLLFGTALLGGCGGGGGGGAAVQKTGPSGAVLQGAVKGATVFADHASGPKANKIMDDDEKKTATLTDDNGNFTLPVEPNYDYVVVSIGGVDSLTGKPAMQMLAPAGAKNISPLTTVVALAPPAQQEAVKNAIAALGISYDTNVAQTLTPAAALLVETINTTVTSVTEVLNKGGNTLPTSSVNTIQQTILSNIAAQISTIASSSTPTAAAATLTNTATLTTTVQTSVSQSLTSITSTMSNVTIAAGSVNTIANTIASESVTTVANAITTSTGSSTFSTTSAMAESTIIPQTAVTALNNTVASNVTTTQSQVTVVKPPNNTPKITGNPKTSVVIGKDYSFIPNGTDQDATDVLTFSIKLTSPAALPAWLTFNPATGELIGTPGSGDVGTIKGIVITVTDGLASVSLPAFDLTVSTVTGSQGGSN